MPSTSRTCLSIFVLPRTLLFTKRAQPLNLHHAILLQCQTTMTRPQCLPCLSRCRAVARDCCSSQRPYHPRAARATGDAAHLQGGGLHSILHTATTITESHEETQDPHLRHLRRQLPSQEVTSRAPAEQARGQALQVRCERMQQERRSEEESLETQSIKASTTIRQLISSRTNSPSWPPRSTSTVFDYNRLG